MTKSQEVLVDEEEVKPPNERTVYAVITNYADDPHPHCELMTTDRDEAERLMEDCRKVTEPPHPVAWQLVQREVMLDAD
jgi:hypothetical protein